VALVGCHKSTDISEKSGDHSERITKAPAETSEQTYADSMIEEIVEHTMQSQYPEQLDTQHILSDLSCDTLQVPFDISTSLLKDLSLQESIWPKAYQRLFSAHSCLGILHRSDEEKALVVYDNTIESHYSESIAMITVNLADYSTERITLAQRYNSDLMESFTRSIISDSLSIRKTITTTYYKQDDTDSVDSIIVFTETIPLSF